MSDGEIYRGIPIPYLRVAGKVATMRAYHVTNGRAMTAQSGKFPSGEAAAAAEEEEAQAVAEEAAPMKAKEPDSDPFIDEPDAMIALALKAFEEAASDAIAENDRLGIPSPLGRKGKIVMRRPPKAKSADGPA